MSVLLGVPDCEIREKETTTWQTNKIGGSPDWISSGVAQPVCVLCGKPMVLVVQIYCPLAGSPFHRCLHAFVCLAKKCSNQSQGWRVYRTQALDQDFQSRTAPKSPPVDSWGEGQDDWGEGQDDWGEGQDDWGEGQDGSPEDQGGNVGFGQDIRGGDGTGKSDCTGNNVFKETESASATPLNPAVDSTDAASLAASAGKACCVPDTSRRSGIDRLSELSLQDVDSPACSRSSSVRDDRSDVVEAEDMIVDASGVERLMGILSTQRTESATSSTSAGCEDGKEQQPLQVTAFPAFYLNVFEEPTDTGDLSDHVASLLQQYERQEGRKLDSLLGQDQGTSRKRGGDEKYEKVDVRHGDKTCHKFITKMQLFPQQCIRYKWSGSPLFISQPAGGKVPVDKCPSCGSVRKFELQLVPPLIPLLKLTGESDPAVEFGTVLVYTCSTSCWQQTDTWKEECVVLQQDPDQHLFR